MLTIHRFTAVTFLETYKFTTHKIYSAATTTLTALTILRNTQEWAVLRKTQ